ncbi:MAG: hypothetical protein GY711_31105 [bacterium]|nr:hypothetical protein [bacterium]
MIEVAIALPIVLLAGSMFLSMVIAGSRQRQINVETARASGSAQDLLERLRNEELTDLFLLYNADPFDDPGGPGTAPGDTFQVEGLTPIEGVTFVGEVLLPVLNIGTEAVPDWQLREDSNNTDLGTPRDLNGDSVVDDRDHRGDVTLLPVHVRVRWQGRFGDRVFQLHTVLVEMGT